jgi:hypothetical protein
MRAARLGIFFVVALVLTSAGIRVLARPNPGYAWHPTLSAKLDHISSTGEHYDVVFVGDSRAFRGIDPHIVEAELARRGCAANVFNLGAVAMTKFEYDEMMSRLADAPGGTPEVIVTIDALSLSVGLLKDFSVRHRVYMDINDATKYLRYRSSLPLDFGDGTAELADMAAGYAVNQVPVGAVHQLVFQQDAQLDERELVNGQDGYQPWDQFYAEAGNDGLANLRATLTPDVENGGWAARWARENPAADRVADWITTLEAHVDVVPESATAVQMWIPSYYDSGLIEAVEAEWERSGHAEPMINLVDESLVGDYTDPDFFIDYWHLSEAGSSAVSRAAAAQLCPIVEDALAD